MATTTEKIRAIRAAKRLRMIDLAVVLDMTHVTYATREHDQTSWKLNEILSLAKYFCISPRDLLGDEFS